MNKDQREIQRKLRILRYADEIAHVAISDTDSEVDSGWYRIIR